MTTAHVRVDGYAKEFWRPRETNSFEVNGTLNSCELKANFHGGVTVTLDFAEAKYSHVDRMLLMPNVGEFYD